MLQAKLAMWSIFSVLFSIAMVKGVLRGGRNDSKNDPRSNGDLALWIDEKQVKMFSGKYSA